MAARIIGSQGEAETEYGERGGGTISSGRINDAATGRWGVKQQGSPPAVWFGCWAANRQDRVDVAQARLK